MGLAGPTGATGPQGEQGVQGDTGEVGPGAWTIYSGMLNSSLEPLTSLYGATKFWEITVGDVGTCILKVQVSGTITDGVMQKSVWYEPAWLYVPNTATPAQGKVRIYDSDPTIEYESYWILRVCPN